MKILIHSDDPRAHTGYGIQANKMGSMFKKMGHEVLFTAQFSMDLVVQVVDIDGFAFKIFGMGKGNFINPQALTEIFANEKFDLMITMADWQMVEKMTELPAEIFVRWVCYCAADAEMLTTRWDYLIQEIPYMVFFTPKFGEKVVKGRRLGYVNYVPLTVDSEVFKVLPERKEIQAAARQRMGWDKDCKIILTVARNQWRKNYPEIIIAARDLEKLNPGKFRFAFHCKPQEDFGWDLPKLMDYYNVQGLVAISDQDVKDKDLNHIYNSADIFLLPSQGEGFGIPLVEAAMCELPVLTTGDTASLDIAKMIGWNDFCLPHSVIWQNGPTIPRPYVTAGHMVDALLPWVNYTEAGHGKQGRELAIKEFSPAVAEKKWAGLLDEAKGILDMRLGNTGPYLGGKTYVAYDFPTT